MNTTFLPIRTIGQSDWSELLSTYLTNFEIDIKGISQERLMAMRFLLGGKLPPEIELYYQHFGDISTSDFMHNLYPIEKFCKAEDITLEFLEEFNDSEKESLILFAESPGNDPVCFDFNTGEIYIFSHDPLVKAKVFADFSDYLTRELLFLEYYMRHENLGDFEAIEKYANKILNNEGIDIEIRNMKFL